MKHDKLATTQTTQVFTGMNNTTETLRRTQEENKSKKSTVYKLKRGKVREKVYDPANPFTFWLKGKQDEDEYSTQTKKEKRENVKSAQSEHRRVPYFEKLSKKPGTYTREGFFKKLRNEIGDAGFDGTREDILRNNLIMFEQKFEDKSPDVDFNDLVFKVKRIPVKKYIEYKREIRLSKLKQVDIEANINDMKNLIVKADEELEENIGTEKKSIEEINQAVKYSREKLEQEKKRRLETNQFYNNVVRDHNDIKTSIAHLDNDIRELRAKNELMEKNREFLLYISGLDEDPKWTPPEGMRMLESEMVFVGEFKDYQEHALENEDDLFKESGPGVMITEAGNVIKKNSGLRDFSKLSDMEEKNSLLRELKSPEEFMDKLRTIESDNLDIIQYSQNTVEEINQLDKKIKQLQIDHAKELSELELNKKNLEDSKRNLERTIAAKLETIEKANQNKLQSEPQQLKVAVDQTSPKGGKKNSKDRLGTPVDIIEDIFNDCTIEEFKKEYQGAGILQQLLCIEKCLKIFKEFMSHKKDFEAELKKYGKLPDFGGNKKRKEEMKLKEEELRKKEKEDKLKEKLGKKKTRRDMSKTHIQEKKEEAQVDYRDVEREQYEKYFKFS